jgi:hypothetical protein
MSIQMPYLAQKIERGNAEVFGRGNELLRIRPENLSDKLELKYQPSYFHAIMAAYIGGLILLLLSWMRIRRREMSGSKREHS